MKIAELKDNMDLKRIDSLTEKDVERPRNIIGFGYDSQNIHEQGNDWRN